ncbi:MAG: adenylate/guanylate cyclase domain-containing protein [Acidimicrobiales bacterium]
MNCRSCGEILADNARFCSNCGTSRATVDEERRIITAVFADIVGFTSLAEHRDPEEVKHFVDRAFAGLTDDITTFGGVVDKIVGDQIVALFGAPVAHSDDAERAVRAGLRMQSTIAGLGASIGPALAIRVGINTGEVLVGSTTAGGDYTAMGDVMNSASRLQEMAEPGQVLVGSTTKNAAGDSVRFEPVGELPTRGRVDPLETWVAVEATRPPGVRRRKAELFVGRERELAFLEAQAMMAFDLNAAQFSIVLGEPGMGKNRLIEETSDRLAAAVELLVVEGRCVAYGEANVWWPIGEVLRALLDVDRELSNQEASARLRAVLSERFGTANHDVDRSVIALLHALGYETPLRGGERSRNRAEVMLAVTQVLEVELRSRAVVIVLADMHWAAGAVWALLDHLLTELARTPLMVMVSAQSLEEETVLNARHAGSILRLGPLRTEATRQLLEEVGGEISGETFEELVSRSGGNPFFLEELAGFVLEGRSPLPSERHLAAGSVADLDELPDTLRGIVAARLDSLEPRQRNLVEDASVLGRSGSLDGLRTLAKQVRGVDSIDAELAALVNADLFVVNGPRYEFRSDMVRDVAYGTLTKTWRAQRHAGIARYIESSQTGRIRNSVVVAIAEHYRSAAQLVGEVSQVPDVEHGEVLSKALYWLDQAGKRALDVGEPAQAERWYGYGIDLATDDELLRNFLYGRAKARCEIHDVAGSRADLDRMEPMLELDPILAARSLVVRGDVDRKTGDLDRAASELREAADRLAVLDVATEQALALRLLGLTEMDRGDDSLATQALTSSRMVASKAGDRRSEGWALQSLAWHAFTRGKVHSANDLAGQAIDIFAELGDRTGLAWARGVQAWVAFHRNEWDAARELVSAVLPEARRQGDPWAESVTLNLAASLALWSGHAKEAQELAHNAQEVAELAEDQGLLIQSMALEGRALVSLGRIAAGTELLEQAFVSADRGGERDSRRIAIISNCASAARLGEPERAIRWAARFDGVHDDPTSVGEADLAVSLALALLQRGAVEEAAGQLSWSSSGSADPAGRYEEAVAAVIAAIKSDQESVERSVQKVLTGGSTYLDRVLALSARAASRAQRGDEAGCDEALEAARAELEPTDDQPSRLILDLVAAYCGRGDVQTAIQRIEGAGFDGSGWQTVWALATRPRLRK